MARVGHRARLVIPGKPQDVVASLLNILRHPTALVSAFLLALFPSYFVQRLYTGGPAGDSPARTSMLVCLGAVGMGVLLVLLTAQLVARTFASEEVGRTGVPELGPYSSVHVVLAGVGAMVFIVPWIWFMATNPASSIAYVALPAIGLASFSFCFATHVVVIEKLPPGKALIRSAQVAWGNIPASLWYFVILLTAITLLALVVLWGNNAGKNTGWVSGVFAIGLFLVLPGAVTAVPFVRAYLDSSKFDRPRPSRPAGSKPAAARTQGTYVGYGVKKDAPGAGRSGEHRSSMDDSLAIASPAKDLFTKGMGYITLGRPEEAIALLQSAAEMDPELAKGQRFVSATLSLAEAFEKKGDNVRALQFYELYVAESQEGPKRESVRRRIDSLRKTAGVEDER